MEGVDRGLKTVGYVGSCYVVELGAAVAGRRACAAWDVALACDEWVVAASHRRLVAAPLVVAVDVVVAAALVIGIAPALALAVGAPAPANVVGDDPSAVGMGTAARLVEARDAAARAAHAAAAVLWNGAAVARAIAAESGFAADAVASARRAAAAAC